MPLYDALVESNLYDSPAQSFSLPDVFSNYLGKTKTEIRRLIDQKAIKFWWTDEEPNLTIHQYNLLSCRTTQATECTLHEKDYYVFRVGKRNYFSVTRVMDMVLVVPYNF